MDQDGVLDVFRVLFEPTAVFERVREKPRFLAPFVVLCVLMFAVSAAAAPVQAAMGEIVRARMAQGTTPAPAGGGGTLVRALIGAPIGVGIGLLIASLVLWVVVSLFGQDADFRKLLSVAAYTFITGVLLQAATNAVLLLRGVETLTSFADFQVALGLNLLVPGATGFLSGFLGAFNPFGIWGLVLVAIGIATTHKTAKGTAYGAASVAFLIGALFQGALMALGSMFMAR